ncbi:RB1-inducible coiled-coil protein 1-like [Acanthaster planci]|uniref:RB1-inducible coiled-coil protein 1 n=1 Tax=Acanthaster planci TaxID=133434 RepID=A0A8B7XVL1_ACAPL|nr:RB1-inducible coiled-coil protein 1-like [Acanthaster planci]XP_022084290.1 RB1-inducible coiled-coil protein 1-like [Acanthaster planci]XP_022084291.1 RB1-inducible coiled-coil protein 1-like [Acanthaster planci]XP_022084292.1 RB1-inducible coiled-coil protein 1-like [Acanthaster planci]
MLYVFMVNTGSMLTLDMALTMESVQRLQETLAAEYQLPIDKQVLLISGGQSLDPHIRVCSYSAGTDTNPIFLFSKGTIESAMPPVTSSMLQSKEEKLRLQVEGLKNLPHSYSAVVARTQLALQFHDLAKENLRLCEGLVHDQHLQQQGWMAVVANLEDITSAFEQRASAFRLSMTEFLEERPQLVTQLAEFGDVLRLLEKTPLLPCLLDESNIISRDTLPEGETLTLMQWISSQDQRSTLQQMAQQCSKSLDQFTQQVLDAMSAEINTTLDAVNNGSMKEVKGLGERLFGLEQLLTSAHKVLQEQAEMAQGMVQNQTRASNLNDASVLPDLCKSHQQQLTVMYKKHCQLAEISRRCQVAKDELCHNLHVRLRWIMYVEQQISAVHSKMLVYHENLKRLRKRLEIVRQVYSAPRLYAAAVVEVWRRRTFASHFTTWAGKVCESSLASHQSEMAKRREFATSMERHFLNVLFPGLIGEVPPLFATTPPGDFDTRLPDITNEDVIALREKLPELSHILKLQEEDLLETEAAYLPRRLRAASSDEQTQTSMNILEVKSNDSEITILKAEPAEGEATEELASLEPQELGGPPQRPDSLPNGKKFLSVDSSKVSKRSTPLSPDSPQSLSFQHVETFVSAAATPDLALSPLDMSTRGETPFASLLPTQEPNFYSAVTSPLDDAESPSKLPITEGSTAMLIKEVQSLKETLQMKEACLEETQLKLKEVQRQLEQRESELASAKDEKSLYQDKLNVSHMGIMSVAQKLETAIAKVREDCSEMREAITLDRTALSQSVISWFSKIEGVCDQVQLHVTGEKSKAVDAATQHLQMKWDSESNHLKMEITRLNEQIETLKQDCQETQVRLNEREMELAILREKSCKELESLRCQMEVEARKEVAQVESGKQKEIQDLLVTIKEKEDALHMMRETTEEEIDLLRAHLTAENEKCLDALRSELTEKHQREVEDKLRRLQDTQLEELAEFKKTTELRVEAACKDLRQALDKVKEEELCELKAKMEEHHSSKISVLSDTLTARIAEIRKAHNCTVEEIKKELTSARNQQQQLIESSQLGLAEMEESFVIEKQSPTLASEEVQRNPPGLQPSNLDPRVSNPEREQMVLMAERQQTFNEAVSRVAASKDKTIEDLRKTVAELREQQTRNQDTIGKLLTDKGDLDAEMTSALREAHKSQKSLQDAIVSKDTQLAELQQKLQAAESKSSSPAELLVSSERDTMKASSATEGRLQALLKSKEQECTTLKHQVMQLRVSQGSTSRAEKISIVDISVGDLVLIFFEEPRDNYVVFSIEPTLYFVHSESLPGLDLKRHGSDGPKRQWIIGRVSDKEYCQAKKANNRFKVAMGTKFYRVKAKKYDLRQEHSGAK